jgi:hypothetical protein
MRFEISHDKSSIVSRSNFFPGPAIFITARARQQAREYFQTEKILNLNFIKTIQN